MLKFLERYWVTLLGIGFLLGSFYTLFEMALDHGWLPPTARAAVGLVAGVSVGFVAYQLFVKGKQIMAEVVAGFSSALFFLTIAYASFSEHIMWSPNILMLAMIAIGAIILGIGYRFNMKILTLLSTVAGLATPLIIKATPEQVNALFLYVLVLNVVSLVLSVVKDWKALRVVSFFTTTLIFISYYIYFEPESWQKPFFYVSALFSVYIVGLFATSKVQNNQFSGLNFYLGIINAIHYVFWSIFIFSSFEVAYALPTLVVAISFIGGAIFIHKQNPNELIPALAYLMLGLFVLAISGEDFSQLFSSKGMPYVVNGALWLSIALCVIAVGFKTKIRVITQAGIGAWMLVVVYWYAVAWEVEWLPWFGLTFIPFINPGALLWISIAASAFVLSRKILETQEIEADFVRTISLVFGMIGHVVVGGLLTIQIDNLWEAYSIEVLKSAMLISTAWFLYALGLFLWGKYTKTKPFLWLGAGVLVISSAKMWLLDLPGEATIYKVLFSALSGGVILLVGYVHRAWIDQEKIEVEHQELKNENNEF